jgi:hypothetical protein
MPSPYLAGACLPDSDFAAIRRHLVLRGCKWDPQVGDTATLAPFPLLLRRSAWQHLAAEAEALAAEAMDAERELLASPQLQRLLGLPQKLCAVLDGARCAAAARVLRFDFHWTTEGWRISEVNSDVPGGYAEASTFTSLISARVPGSDITGDPLRAWASALAQAAGDGPVVLLTAPGYLEDQQVVAALARVLVAGGTAAHVAQPEQLSWHDGRARLTTSWFDGSVGAVARFYQAEWLAPRVEQHRPLFSGGRTPVSNPGSAIILESKRFPLAWGALHTPLVAWRRLLPEARDPRDAPWLRTDDWVLKGALANNGDSVLVPGLANAHARRRCAFDAALRPSAWVAQRRFEAVPLATPHGPRFPCLGVYTIDGRAEGVYGRLAARPLIDHAAVDVAVLLDPQPDEAPR